MRTESDKESILEDFAMEGDLETKVLSTYIRRYPDLALELTDLFHDLTMADLGNLEEETLGDEEIEGDELREGVAKVQAALSGQGLRDLARKLGLPRDFVAGFRDARVRLGSVPSSVLLNLARAINAKIQYFVAYLQAQTGAMGAVAFKADTKPQGPSVLEYDEFIASLDLDDGEVAALRRLEGQNGRD